MIRLHYDGRWTDFPGENRQWTLLSHFLDQNGADRYRGSFGLDSLIQFGIVKGAH